MDNTPLNTVHDLSEFKIKSILKTLHDVVIASPPQKIFFNLNETRNALMENNVSNAYLKNIMEFLFLNLDEKNAATKFKANRKNIEAILKHAKDEIITNGTKKIKRYSSLFVPFFSEEIFSILNNALLNNKKVTLNIIEHKPFNTGKRIANKFCDKKIDMNFFLDSNLLQAIIQSDLCLIPAETITNKGEIISFNPIKSISIIAKENLVPMYVCCNTLRVAFDDYVKELLHLNFNQEDIWVHTHTNVNLNNFIYEAVPAKNVQAIISEGGIFPPNHFIEEVKNNHNKLINYFS
ncbi:hypothetical protein JXB41_04835 [Candidatus Woesearchaeota archaeon]|nr:hypothetical protein [Candidatus Woesearchaeota archaeon]